MTKLENKNWLHCKLVVMIVNDRLHRHIAKAHIKTNQPFPQQEAHIRTNLTWPNGHLHKNHHQAPTSGKITWFLVVWEICVTVNL